MSFLPRDLRPAVVHDFYLVTDAHNIRPIPRVWSLIVLVVILDFEYEDLFFDHWFTL